MKPLKFAAAMVVPCVLAAMPAHAQDKPLECRNMWEYQKADVDGPVLSVKDLGPQKGGKGRYHMIVRDHFTGCRVSNDTDTVCRIGQHASIVGGALGMWQGDVKDTDTDYQYMFKDIWDCE